MFTGPFKIIQQSLISSEQPLNTSPSNRNTLWVEKKRRECSRVERVHTVALACGAIFHFIALYSHGLSYTHNLQEEFLLSIFFSQHYSHFNAWELPGKPFSTKPFQNRTRKIEK